MMIARIWHGWTTPENTAFYEQLLKNEVFPSIESKKVKGYEKNYHKGMIKSIKVIFILAGLPLAIICRFCQDS